jgi:predicted dehydrogenase
LILPKSKNYHGSYPNNVVVIGGGRWARVIVEELHKLSPPEVNISIHSLHNAKGMEAWVSNKGFENKIDVYSFLPNSYSNTSTAVIIVNAASDHDKSLRWALERDYSVLVEKPLSLNFLAA